MLLQFCLAAHLPCLLPLPSHLSLPPSSLCSRRASHLEQQAAGGDDIICTAAHCSTGSEQRHVSLPLTIPSLSLHLSVCVSSPLSARGRGRAQPCTKAGCSAVTYLNPLIHLLTQALSLEQALNSSPRPFPQLTVLFGEEERSSR